jgi:protein TonB
MTATRAPSMLHRWSETLRWSACFALALCFHVAGAAALMARWNDNADLIANAPVIMIDLAPVAVAPEIKPNELPPGPQQMQAQPEPQPDKPVEKIVLPVQPDAEPLLSVTPPPKTVEKPKEKQPTQKHASLASAPSTAEQKADRAAAPIPGASSRDPNALPNWKSQLVAQIERHKRFDGSARGVVQVAFGVDRSGGVHHARVEASSGSNVLDRDAIAWLERSQPLPPPPPDITGSLIPITVPLRYNYR